MKLSKFFTLAALAAFAATANAQFANTSKSFSRSSGSGIIVRDCDSYSRLEVGYLGTNFNLKTAWGDFKTDCGDLYDFYDLKGFTLGYARGISLSKEIPVFLEVGSQINYGTHNESEEENEYVSIKVRTNLLTLAVPVTFVGKLSFSNGIYLAPYLGIHFDVNLLFNDKTKYSYSYRGDSGSETDTDSYFEEDGYKRFQMGFQSGLNVGYKKFNLGVGYRGNFMPIYKEEGHKMKTGGPVVTLGYNF